jgi:hypothetical protein
MYIKLDKTTFREQFDTYGRGDNFSYDGLDALFEYLEEMEDSTGEEMQLDVIALCCEYTEESVENIAAMYNVEPIGGQTLEYAVIDFLQDAGAFVAKTSTGTIVFWNQ